MTAGNADSSSDDPPAPAGSDTAMFDATILPHRSLGAAGFRTLMGLVCLVSLAASIPFIMLGAWPVAGFLGLDALALFIAFRVNFRAGRAFERIVVTPLEVWLRKVSHRGEERNWRFNPAWTKLHAVRDEDYGVLTLALVSRDLAVPVASALSAHEREDFAIAFGAALVRARDGARYS